MNLTVKELAKTLNCKILTCPDETDRQVTGCYIGDLLSWVMGRANEGDAWLTIMGNINAVAVATLADVACIILTENASLDAEAKTKAEQQGVVILQTEANSYSTAIALYKLMSDT